MLSPVHVDLPVGLAGDIDVEEVSAVIFGVGPSEQQLATGLRVRVPDEGSTAGLLALVLVNQGEAPPLKRYP